MAKRASSPAEQKHNKKARTPSSEEEEEGTDEMARHSEELCQKRERSQACSKSRIRRRQRAKSQARAQVAKAVNTKESFIPVGYEDTRQEELQREDRREREQASKDKAQERQQRGAEKAAQMEEKPRDEVLYDQKGYVRRTTDRLTHPRLPVSDPHVRCLWIFAGNTSTYTAHVLALCDWANKYFKISGEYPVPKLPGWLTTYVHVMSIP